jgi:hypothetical protein
MRIFYFILYYCFVSTAVYAQRPLSGMYKSKNGHVVITGQQNSVNVTGQSDQLLIVLNCESAEMSAKVDINTITTGIDLSDGLLGTINSTAFFKGKMGADILRMEDPPPIHFDIDGILTLNSISRPMKINASLDRISDDENAGVLSGNLAISLNDFNLKGVMPDFSDILLIQFSQVLLRRVCE